MIFHFKNLAYFHVWQYSKLDNQTNPLPETYKYMGGNLNTLLAGKKVLNTDV